jgi:hypothetical protein
MRQPFKEKNGYGLRPKHCLKNTIKKARLIDIINNKYLSLKKKKIVVDNLRN